LKKVITLSFLAVLALNAAENNKKNELITHTELSYVQTQGNTDTNAFSLDFTGDKSWDKHSLKLDLDILYGTDNSIETKNKLLTELNYDYQFVKYFTVNYLVGYKYDKFSGFDYQFYTGPGVKYLAIETKVHKLDFQGNILYNADETMDKYYDSNGDEIKYPYPDGTDGATVEKGETDNYTGYSLKLNYNWQIIESLKFIQELSYRSDFDNSDNYFAFSKTAIETKISDIFSMGISYKVDYTNLPPSEKEYSDRTFMTSLIIDY